MTSHTLAKMLLEKPDMPVELHVGTPKDTFIGDVGDCDTRVGEIDMESAEARGLTHIEPGPCMVLRGWQSSEKWDDED
jgi:hypothetical protein